MNDSIFEPCRSGQCSDCVAEKFWYGVLVHCACDCHSWGDLEDGDEDTDRFDYADDEY